MKAKVADPSATIVPSNPPFSFLTTVAIASSLDVAVVAAITAAASLASAGTAEMVKVLVSPTLPVHVF